MYSWLDLPGSDSLALACRMVEILAAKLPIAAAALVVLEDDVDDRLTVAAATAARALPNA